MKLINGIIHKVSTTTRTGNGNWIVVSSKYADMLSEINEEYEHRVKLKQRLLKIQKITNNIDNKHEI
jgi:hypothetical protein